MSRVAANPHPAAVVVLLLTPIRGAERDRGRLVEGGGRGVDGLLLVVFWVDALLTNRIRTTFEELMEEKEDVGGSSITIAWDLMVAQPLQLTNSPPSSDMSPFLKQICSPPIPSLVALTTTTSNGVSVVVVEDDELVVVDGTHHPQDASCSTRMGD